MRPLTDRLTVEEGVAVAQRIRGSAVRLNELRALLETIDREWHGQSFVEVQAVLSRRVSATLPGVLSMRQLDVFARAIADDTYTPRLVALPGASVARPTDAERDAALARLRFREQDVLIGIARGWSNQDIADELHIGVNSVKTYIRYAYAKIGVRSRSQAVVWAVRHGLHHRVLNE